RLASGALVRRLRDGEAAEAARVDETDLAPAAERKNRMGMRRHGSIGSGDEQAAAHAEVHQKLRCLSAACDIDNDSFSDTMDALDTASSEHVGDLIGRRFK